LLGATREDASIGSIQGSRASILTGPRTDEEPPAKNINRGKKKRELGGLKGGGIVDSSKGTLFFGSIPERGFSGQPRGERVNGGGRK